MTDNEIGEMFKEQFVKLLSMFLEAWTVTGNGIDEVCAKESVRLVPIGYCSSAEHNDGIVEGTSATYDKVAFDTLWQQLNKLGIALGSSLEELELFGSLY
jgi:hypothetical protein